MACVCHPSCAERQCGVQDVSRDQTCVACLPMAEQIIRFAACKRDYSIVCRLVMFGVCKLSRSQRPERCSHSSVPLQMSAHRTLPYPAFHRPPASAQTSTYAHIKARASGAQASSTAPVQARAAAPTRARAPARGLHGAAPASNIFSTQEGFNAMRLCA